MSFLFDHLDISFMLTMLSYAAKAGLNKPKPSAGTGGQAGALPSSPSSSPAAKAQQQQQPPMGSPGVAASVAEEAASQAARRAASNGATQPTAPSTTQQRQQPGDTSSSLAHAKKAAGAELGGSGAAAAAPKAKKASNGGAAGGGAAEQFAGPMPEGTQAAMMRFQDAVAGVSIRGHCLSACFMHVYMYVLSLGPFAIPPTGWRGHGVAEDNALCI